MAKKGEIPMGSLCTWMEFAAAAVVSHVCCYPLSLLVNFEIIRLRSTRFLPN